MANQNLKIVCIVHNPSNRSDEGLSKTFNKGSNYFINSYLYSFADGQFSAHFGYNKFLLISNNGSVQSKPNIIEGDCWDILLVCDSLSLDNYPGFIFTENTLVMYHQKPHITNAETIFEIKNIKIKKGKKGQHEYNIECGYFHLFGITDAWGDDGNFNQTKYDYAKQIIIDWFGVNDELEAKLELLHNCLVPESIPEAIDELLSSYKPAFNKFKETIKGKALFEAEYINELTKFRNILLDIDY